MMMDEPEISLHISWQYELLNWILELNPNVQLVLTTHSPSIFSDGWGEKAIYMEDITTRKKSESTATCTICCKSRSLMRHISSARPTLTHGRTTTARPRLCKSVLHLYVQAELACLTLRHSLRLTLLLFTSHYCSWFIA